MSTRPLPLLYIKKRRETLCFQISARTGHLVCYLSTFQGCPDFFGRPWRRPRSDNTVTWRRRTILPVVTPVLTTIPDVSRLHSHFGMKQAWTFRLPDDSYLSVEAYFLFVVSTLQIGMETWCDSQDVQLYSTSRTAIVSTWDYFKLLKWSSVGSLEISKRCFLIGFQLIVKFGLCSKFLAFAKRYSTNPHDS